MVQHRKTDESCETRELSEDRQSIEQEDILDLADEGGDGEFVLYCHLKVEGGRGGCEFHPRTSHAGPEGE